MNTFNQAECDSGCSNSCVGMDDVVFVEEGAFHRKSAFFDSWGSYMGLCCKKHSVKIIQVIDGLGWLTLGSFVNPATSHSETCAGASIDAALACTIQGRLMRFTVNSLVACVDKMSCCGQISSMISYLYVGSGVFDSRSVHG